MKILQINEDSIINKLSADGDLREGEDLETFEVYENDDLGFYQYAADYLVSKLASHSLKFETEIARLKAERDALNCEVKTLRNYIEKNSKILESIALILCESEDLPCGTDEFSWEDMPELIADMLGIDD